MNDTEEITRYFLESKMFPIIQLVIQLCQSPFAISFPLWQGVCCYEQFTWRQSRN